MAKITRSVAPKPPTLVVNELNTLEKELGGREELVGMLALAPLTPSLTYALGLLGDPRYSARPLAEICALGNILPSELMKHLSSAALLKGKVLAHRALGRGIQAVAQDIVRRAAPYEEPCPTCMVDGMATGRVTPEPSPQKPNPEPEPCPDCKGSKALRYMPDLSRQQLAVEMAQLLPKSGGLQILQQQFTKGSGPDGGSAGSGSLERLQQMTDKILYGDGLPVDGEIVDAAPVPPAVEGGSDA